MLVDMPLEKLREYRGRNPRPADFDQYWDKSLAEMAALDPAVELIPVEMGHPTVECLDMYFTGVGGARIHAKLLRPRHQDKPAPAVVQFHGYSGDSGEWCDKLNYASAGFTVASIDVRGQGGHSQDVGGHKWNTLHGHIIRGVDGEPEDLLFRSIYLDCAQLVRLVMAMPNVDAKRVGCYGGSQGGGLTLAATSLVPEVNRAAPVFPFLSDYQRVWEMDLAQAAYQEIKDYFRHFDPMHQREEEFFTRLGYIDIHHLTPRIKAKILMFTGLMDTVCPPSTQFAAYNNITSPKDVKIFPDFGHEGIPTVGDQTFRFMMEMLQE